MAHLKPSQSVVILFILHNSTIWLSIVMRAKPVTFSANLEIVGMTDAMSHPSPLHSCHHHCLPLPSLINILHTLLAAAHLAYPIQAGGVNVEIQNEHSYCNVGSMFPQCMPQWVLSNSPSLPDDGTYEDRNARLTTSMPKCWPWKRDPWCWWVGKWCYGHCGSVCLWLIATSGWQGVVTSSPPLI